MPDLREVFEMVKQSAPWWVTGKHQGEAHRRRTTRRHVLLKRFSHPTPLRALHPVRRESVAGR